MSKAIQEMLEIEQLKSMSYESINKHMTKIHEQLEKNRKAYKEIEASKVRLRNELTKEIQKKDKRWEDLKKWVFSFSDWDIATVSLEAVARKMEYFSKEGN